MIKSGTGDTFVAVVHPIMIKPGMGETFVATVHSIMIKPGTGDTFIAAVHPIMIKPGTGDTFVAAVHPIMIKPGTGDTFVAAVHPIMIKPGTGDTSARINRKVDTSLSRFRCGDLLVRECDLEPGTVNDQPQMNMRYYRRTKFGGERKSCIVISFRFITFP